VPSGPGGEDGDDLSRVFLISSFVNAGRSVVLGQASSQREGVLFRDKMVQEGLVDRHRVCGTWEGGESRGVPGGYERFSSPYVVGSCFSEEVCPVGCFSSLDGFEVA